MTVELFGFKNSEVWVQRSSNKIFKAVETFLFICLFIKPYVKNVQQNEIRKKNISFGVFFTVDLKKLSEKICRLESTLNLWIKLEHTK